MVMGGRVLLRETECVLFLHLRALWRGAVVCRDATCVSQTVWVMRCQVGSAVDVRTVVDVVGPFCDCGVTHGAVPCLSFAPPDVCAPRCVEGVSLYEVKESGLWRFQVLSE